MVGQRGGEIATPCSVASEVEELGTENSLLKEKAFCVIKIAIIRRLFGCLSQIQVSISNLAGTGGRFSTPSDLPGYDDYNRRG